MLLTQEGVALSAQILRRLRDPDSAELVETVAKRQGVGPGGPTRQAIHARLQRLHSTVTAGAVLLATREQAYQDFVLSRDFSLLRPMSAGTHLKVRHLLRQLPVDPDGALRLFDRCFAELLKLAGLFPTLEAEPALRVNGIIVGMLVAPVLLGAESVQTWSAALVQARAAGLLEHPYLELQLLLMGSFAGEWRPHGEWLMHPDNRQVEMADVYLFVRRDFGPDVFALQARQARGEVFPARSSLYPARPGSTLNLLLDYACGCMRDTRHLESPALSLMLLYWLRDLQRDLRELPAPLVTAADRQGILERLLKVERIQIMEKRRFWAMVDGLEPSPLRNELTALWNGSHHGPALARELRVSHSE
ncbi:MAG: hypothetical protein RL033_6771 [Pseudomonadota bacterium]|jgi:hypothetical protein